MSRRSFALQRIRRWLPRLLGLALSVVAIAIVGPRKVMTGLGAANPWLVAIAAVAVFPLLAPKARRWQIVLADFGIALPWRDAFRFYAIGLWAAIITPGQLGDGLKAWYVQSRGGNLAPALASVVVDRLFDVLMLLGAASIGAAIYGAAFGAQFVVVGILTVVTVGGIAAAARPALRRRAGALLPAALRQRIARLRWIAAVQDAHLSGASLLHAFGWSVASFAATLARIYLCFRAVDVRLALPTFVAVVGLSSLAGLLSVS
ncbi:MAG: flippase-like domain-containing protein, partial [Thermomicrobia bacterium]|nr:flippase-like domain-containing protein [Thermomicrobia bacterium]